MEATFKLKLGEYQLIALQKLANAAGTDINTIISQIVQVYLNGKAPSPAPSKYEVLGKQLVELVKAAGQVVDIEAPRAAPPKPEPLRKALPKAQPTFKPEPIVVVSAERPLDEYDHPSHFEKKAKIGRPRRLNDEQIAALRVQRKNGASYSELARTFGIGIETARRAALDIYVNN